MAQDPTGSCVVSAPGWSGALPDQCKSSHIGWHTTEGNIFMKVRSVIGKTVIAAVAVGALSGVGAGLASAGPGDITTGDDGLTTIDLGTGNDPILGNTTVDWP